MEISITIKLEGDGFASPEELELRDELEDLLIERCVGEIVDAGSGMGTMDISVDVEDTERAKEVIQAILEELHIDTRKASVEVEECDETPYPAVYEPGDCLAMKLPDGDYGAVLVLAATDDDEPDGWNLVGILNYKCPEKPTLAVFEQREWLILSHHAWRNRPEIRWCWASTYPEYAELFEHVGRVEIRPDDAKESNT